MRENRLQKKALNIFFAIFFFVLGFSAQNVLAATYGLGVSCLGASCTSAPATVDTASMTAITLDGDGFDDCGWITITGPSGASQNHNTSNYPAPCSVAGQHIAPGDITSWFGFDGVGVYSITVTAINGTCCASGAWANFTVTTVSLPTCSLTASPSSISVGGSSTLSWTTTNMAFPSDTASISDGGSFNYTVSSTTGNVTVTPTASTTYTMTVTNVSGSSTCSIPVSIAGPSCTLIAGTPVVVGLSTSLDWTATNANGGSINPGSITLAMPPNYGSATSGPITGPTTFTMSVTGPGGTGSCSSSVTTVTPPTGGIVPCGRLLDNSATPYNETDPCNLCHIFIMIQIVTSWVFTVGTITAIFFIIVGGLIYATSAGDERRMDLGKRAVTWAIVGLALIILSWLIVTVALSTLGYVNPLGGQWNIVNCSV